MTATPTDPLLALPAEIFAQLHLLSQTPSTVAQSSAVSNASRQIVNSNPALHQEIDLIRAIGAQIIQHLYTFIDYALSHHKVTKVSLELGDFKSTLLSGVFDTLQLSKNNLRSMVLAFNVQDDDGTAILLPILVHLRNLPSLQTVLINFPICISIESGGELPSYKSSLCNRLTSVRVSMSMNSFR